MKYRDIAEVLEIPVGTVKSRLHAALARLTEDWKAAEQAAAEQISGQGSGNDN
jgi:RNA polymerase sigma-70 factor (ECF subfamily)